MKKIILTTALLLMVVGLSAEITNVQTVTVSGGNVTTHNHGEDGMGQTVDQSQIDIYYDYRHLTDTTDNTKFKEDVMILQFGMRMSKFYSYQTMVFDSLLSISSPEEVLANINKFRGGESFVIYNDFAKGEMEYIDKIAQDYISYTEPTPSFEWQLLDEEKEILGLPCKRAECSFRGRNYVAWYCEALPIPSGPWKFGGLPGVILEVADSEGHYSFTASAFHLEQTRPITKKELQLHKTTRKKYMETKRLFDKDPIGYMQTVSNISITIKSKDGKEMTNKDRTKVLMYDYIERDYKK